MATLTLKAGDRVILEPGDWIDQELVFRGKGTQAEPIRLTVDIPGNVVLTGNSSLVIDGNWLVVDGLSFKGENTLSHHGIRFSEASSNCRLTNTAVIDYSNSDRRIRNSWIVVLGKKNRVDHCYTEGKTNNGPTLHVGPTADEKVYNGPHEHRIDHNYFAHRPPFGRNGAESIVVGSGNWYEKSFHTLVEFNVFERCDGESEVISVKATNNTIRHNLFYESKGMLYLRHGDANVVYGNYFIGNNIKGSGGVHIIGKHQRVYDNYFYGLTNGVIVRNGWEKSWIYIQVDDLQLANNTFISCEQTLVLGWDKDARATLPAVNSLVSSNLFVSKEEPIVWTNENDQKDNRTLVFESNASIPLENGDAAVLKARNGATWTKNEIGIYGYDRVDSAQAAG
ncbi:hypothetical protein G5B35_23620, partial [Parapusillimonas sp. SGNA-6]|nr:hypothetical protein [Parapusillimonas sp. SGNA-6]